MKIHEYQGKEIFRNFSIPTPKGYLIEDIGEAESVVSKAQKDFKTEALVIKAQIHAGGRGKGGGVKVSKDYDDALSVKKMSNGNWEIGIHIADVSYYVKENDIIDREASDRSTSVYLVDRVVPMLPEVLSNEVCSLKSNVDRFCYSVTVSYTHLTLPTKA